MINYIIGAIILLGIAGVITLLIVLLLKITSKSNNRNKSKLKNWTSVKSTNDTQKIEELKDFTDDEFEIDTETEKLLNDNYLKNFAYEIDKLKSTSPLAYAWMNTSNSVSRDKDPEYIKRNLRYRSGLVAFIVSSFDLLHLYNNEYSVGAIAYIEENDCLYIKVNETDWKYYNQFNYINLLEEVENYKKNKMKD